MNRTRPGFTILELAIALGLIGIIYLSLIKGINNVREDVKVAKEISFYSDFQSAVKKTFIAALDTAEQQCGNVTTDATNAWGWNTPACNASDPYPVFALSGTTRTIYWDWDFSGTAGLSLRNTIRTSFENICPLFSETSTKLTLKCPDLLGIQYDLGSGYTNSTPMATSSTSATDRRIDPILVPAVRLSYERSSTMGNLISTQTFDFSMNDVYTLRKAYSRSKINQIRKALFQFNKAQTFAEIGNTPDTGLHSMDDEFVPWFWEAFRVSTVLGAPTLCSLSGGNSCTNIGSWWRSPAPTGRGAYMRGITSLFFSGDPRYFVDGFGNGLYLYPITSQCTAADFATCTVTAPPIPAKDYLSGTTRPPYASVLYIDGYSSKTSAASGFTRSYIAY